jgi:hypothetical protein
VLRIVALVNCKARHLDGNALVLRPTLGFRHTLGSTCWLILQRSLAALWSLWLSQERLVRHALDIESEHSSLHERLDSSNVLLGECAALERNSTVENVVHFRHGGRSRMSRSCSTGLKRFFHGCGCQCQVGCHGWWDPSGANLLKEVEKLSCLLC